METAKRELMTWNSTSKRWFKKHSGKQHAVSLRTLQQSYPELFTGNSKEGSYRAANAWWTAKKTVLDDGPEKSDWLEALTTRQNMVTWLQRERDTDTDLYRTLTEEIETASTALKTSPVPRVTLLIDPLVAFKIPERLIWMKRLGTIDTLQRWEVTGTAKKSQSLKLQVGLFLKAKSVECSIARVDTMRNHLRHFLTYLQSDDLTVLTSANLLDFRADLLTRNKRGAMTLTFAGDIIQTAWAFIDWLWQREVLENMPRVSKRKLRITPERRKIKTFSIEQVQTVLNAVRGKRRLYYLLMLNCGMTQKDIADLRPTEIDYGAGTITRRRSKTADHENVPEVQYKLWNETWELLKKYGNRNGDRALVTKKGTPLVLVAEKTTGKSRVHKVDLIGRAYTNLRKKLGVALPPLKSMRKTGATVLDRHDVHSSFAQYFLGHAPTSIMDRHYRDRSQTRFDAAVKWLGEQYGIV
jgi:integrase